MPFRDQLQTLLLQGGNTSMSYEEVRNILLHLNENETASIKCIHTQEKNKGNSSKHEGAQASWL